MGIETKIIKEYAFKSISELSIEYNLSYKEIWTLLKRNGVRISRGRRRGSGVGVKTEIAKNGKVDRRTAWQIRQIEAGNCTSCGGPNKSESLYHCESCLKKRTEAKKQK